MDPLSITVGVLAIVGRSISAIQTCQSQANKYLAADLSMSSMRTECAAIKVALGQIQKVLVRDRRRRLGERYEDDVLKEYESVLTGCESTFNALNDQLSALGLEGTKASDESTFRAKLKFVWNEPQMKDIQGNIRGQANAIGILLSAFQAETAEKTYSIMRDRSNMLCFKRVSHDAESLRRSLAASNGSSGDQDTTYSFLGDEDFAFDDIVLNSTAYRRAFIKQTSKAKLREATQDEGSPEAVQGTSELSTHPEEISGRVSSAVVRKSSKTSLVTLQKVLPPLPGSPSASPRPSVDTARSQIATPIADSYIVRRLSETRPSSRPSSSNLVTTTSEATNPSPPAPPFSIAPNGTKSEQLAFFEDYYSNDHIKAGDLVSALWAYQPRAADEFALERGNVLCMVGIWDDGWATGYMTEMRAESVGSRHPNDLKPTISREIKAFPLVCVCLPQHWMRTIVGDGSVEIDLMNHPEKIVLGADDSMKSSKVTTLDLPEPAPLSRRSLAHALLKSLVARQKVDRKVARKRIGPD